VEDWYGSTERTVKIAWATALWYSTGLPAVPIRWVLVRDPQGTFVTQALLCTDLGARTEKIVGCFVPRRKGATEELSAEHPTEETSSEEVHPARRWVVERTVSWLNKRRGVRTRWSKKAENWLALVRLTCAHVLLNLAVFG
jgi:hypothetical protein